MSLPRPASGASRSRSPTQRGRSILDFDRLIQDARTEEERFLRQSVGMFRAQDAQAPGAAAAQIALMSRAARWRLDKAHQDDRTVRIAERQARQNAETAAESASAGADAQLLRDSLRAVRAEWNERARQAAETAVRDALLRRAARGA